MSSFAILLVFSFNAVFDLNSRFIRLGTSGGIGVEPGTVVVTVNAMNADLSDKFVQWIAGKKVTI